MKNLANKVSDKVTGIAIGAAMALPSTGVLAAGWESDANTTAAFVGGNNSTGSFQSSMGKLYEIVKYAAIVIGLVMCVGGILAVSKASKTEGQKSQAPGWITFALGGVMTVVGTLMFITGNTAKNLATG